MSSIVESSTIDTPSIKKITVDDFFQHKSYHKIPITNNFISSQDLCKVEHTKYATFHNKVELNDTLIIKKLKGILIKLSDKNIDTLEKELLSIEVTSKIMKDYVENLCKYTIECIFYIDLYIRIYKSIKEVNPSLYKAIEEYLLNSFENPAKLESDNEENKTKRYFISNIAILCKLIKSDILENTTRFNEIAGNLYTDPKQNIEPIVKIHEILGLDYNDKRPWLTDLSQDKTIPAKVRFQIQDLIKADAAKQSQ